VKVVCRKYKKRVEGGTGENIKGMTVKGGSRGRTGGETRRDLVGFGGGIRKKLERGER